MNNDERTLINNIKSNLQNVLPRYFVEREELIELLMFSVMAREHLLVIGPPGTGKSALCNSFTELFGGKFFRVLLTRFTEPQELMGPLDIAAFQNGDYTRHSENMLPDADIAFLDDIFNANSAILNTLLTILNERRYYEGHEQKRAKLISAVAASTEVSDDPVLQPFIDRFLLRAKVREVSKVNALELLNKGWINERTQDATVLSKVEIEDIEKLSELVFAVDLKPVQSLYIDFMANVRRSGIEVSDRRIVKLQKILAASALCHGYKVASVMDFRVFKHIWNREQQIPLLEEMVEEWICKNEKDVPDDTKKSYEKSPITPTPESIDGKITRLQEVFSRSLSPRERENYEEELARLKNEVRMLPPHHLQTQEKMLQEIEKMQKGCKR